VEKRDGSEINRGWNKACKSQNRSCKARLKSQGTKKNKKRPVNKLNGLSTREAGEPQYISYRDQKESSRGRWRSSINPTLPFAGRI